MTTPSQPHSGVRAQPGVPAQPGGRGRTRLRRVRDELVAVGITGAAVAIAGVPLGALWSVVAPHVPIVMTAAGPDLADYSSEASVASDGWFAGIGVVTGLLAAMIAWLVVRRYRGPVMAVGLAAGSIGTAWLAWQLGRRIGADGYRDLLSNAHAGWLFYRPVELRAKSVLLTQALVAAFAYTVLAGWSRYPSLRRQDGGASAGRPHQPEPDQPDTGPSAAAGGVDNAENPSGRSWPSPRDPAPEPPGRAPASSWPADPAGQSAGHRDAPTQQERHWPARPTSPGTIYTSAAAPRAAQPDPLT